MLSYAIIHASCHPSSLLPPFHLLQLSKAQENETLSLAGTSWGYLTRDDDIDTDQNTHLDRVTA